MAANIDGGDVDGGPHLRRGRRLVAPWLLGGALAALLVVGAVYLMHEAGLFDTAKDDTGIKRLAAALALAGTVLSAAITLLGTVVKFSIDDRNTSLAELEQKRNAIRDKEADLRAAEAHHRSRVEVILKAAELMGKEDCAAADRQAAGAILALSSLGEHDFAIALLRQVWGDQARFASVAYVVTRRVLGSAAGIDVSDETKIAASALINFKADRIIQGTSHIWPLLEEGWRIEGLPANARLGLVLAAVRWFTDSLEAEPGIPDATYPLYKALDDPKFEIVVVAAEALMPFIDAYGETDAVVYSVDFTDSVPIGEVARQTREAARGLVEGKIGAQVSEAVVKHKARQPGERAPATQLDVRAAGD